MNSCTKAKPDYVDIHAGQKLYTFRMAAGLSQEKLAKEVGIAFQQIQKYEKGKDRISAGRLYKFASILSVDINDFFPNSNSVRMPLIRGMPRRIERLERKLKNIYMEARA